MASNNLIKYNKTMYNVIPLSTSVPDCLYLINKMKNNKTIVSIRVCSYRCYVLSMKYVQQYDRMQCNSFVRFSPIDEYILSIK